MNARVRGWVVVLGPLLIVGACSVVAWETYRNIKGDIGDLPETTISQAEAGERMDGLVRGVVGLFPTGTRAFRRPETVERCAIGLEQKLSGQVRLTAAYDVLDVTPEQFAEQIETFKEYASSMGWKTHGGSTRDMFLWFDVDETFSVGMAARGGNELTILASTGCIWPAGRAGAV